VLCVVAVAVVAVVVVVGITDMEDAIDHRRLPATIGFSIGLQPVPPASFHQISLTSGFPPLGSGWRPQQPPAIISSA
jgi:hypothetical protein